MMSLKITTSLGDLFLPPEPQSPDANKAFLLLEKGASLIPDKLGCQMLALMRSILSACQLRGIGMLITPKCIENLDQI